MRTKRRPPFRGLAVRRFLVAAAALAVCLSHGVARGQSGKGDYIGRWSLAASAGLATPNTDEYSDVFNWRVGVGYSPLPQLEFDLEVNPFSTAVSQPEPEGVPTHDIASGRLAVVPVCLTAQYRFALPERLSTLYLLGGVGYYFVDYAMAAGSREFFAAGGGAGLPDQAVHDGFGFHAGAGLEYALTGWLALTIDGRYLFLSPRVSGTTRDDRTLAGSLDLNTWLFTGGVKVAF